MIEGTTFAKLRQALAEMGLHSYEDAAQYAAALFFDAPDDGFGDTVIRLKTDEEVEELVCSATLVRVSPEQAAPVAQFLATEAATRYKAQLALTPDREIVAYVFAPLASVSEPALPVRWAIGLLLSTLEDMAPRIRALLQSPVPDMAPMHLAGGMPIRSIEDLLAGEFRVD